MIWAGPWENVSYVICEQQRRKSACASAQSDQRLCCSLLRQYNISRFYSRNFKTPASFCGCAGRFVFGLVGNSRKHVLSCRGSFSICLVWTAHISLPLQHSIHVSMPKSENLTVYYGGCWSGSLKTDPLTSILYKSERISLGLETSIYNILEIQNHWQKCKTLHTESKMYLIFDSKFDINQF